MTTARLTPPRSGYRTPLAVRAAQALLLLPLGILQLVAATAFLVADGVHGARDVVVAAWVLIMAPCCIALGLRLGRRRATLLRTALLLLAAEGAFSAVTLPVYHKSASLVFFALIAASGGLLVLPASRLHFVSVGDQS